MKAHTIRISQYLPERQQSRMIRRIHQTARAQGFRSKLFTRGMAHYVAIYVPSTFNKRIFTKREKEVSVRPREFRKRIGKTEQFFRGLFGGETTLPARGTWISDSKTGRVSHDRLGIVESFAPKAAIRRYDKKIRDFVHDEQIEWGQKSISVERDNRLYFKSLAKPKEFRHR